MADRLQYEIHPISTAMFEDVHQFLEEHFFPCAPIARSLGIKQSSQFWTWAWVESSLMEEESLVQRWQWDWGEKRNQLHKGNFLPDLLPGGTFRSLCT